MRLLYMLAVFTACQAYSQTPVSPSYLEFSTFFQLTPDRFSNNYSSLVAPGASNDFYIAGTLAGDSNALSQFPKRPINPGPAYSFSKLSFIARFSPAGDLLAWRLLWSRNTPSTPSPQVLRVKPTGEVLLVYFSSGIVENATPGAFLTDSNGPALLLLSADLQEVPFWLPPTQLSAMPS